MAYTIKRCADRVVGGDFRYNLGEQVVVNTRDVVYSAKR
jgi:hypothetical protein